MKMKNDDKNNQNPENNNPEDAVEITTIVQAAKVIKELKAELKTVKNDLDDKADKDDLDDYVKDDDAPDFEEMQSEIENKIDSGDLDDLESRVSDLEDGDSLVDRIGIHLRSINDLAEAKIKAALGEKCLEDGALESAQGLFNSALLASERVKDFVENSSETQYAMIADAEAVEIIITRGLIAVAKASVKAQAKDAAEAS